MQKRKGNKLKSFKNDVVISSKVQNNNEFLSQEQREIIAFYDNLDYEKVEYFDVGNQDKICEFCQAKHFEFEKHKDQKFRGITTYKNCCHYGTIMLPEIEYPEILKNLFEYKHPLSDHFIENIRVYNSALSFGILHTKINQSYETNGCPVVTMNGLYHFLTPASMTNTDKNQPKFSQLYYVDTDEALKHRSNQAPNVKCNSDLLDQLDKSIRKINLYSKVFRNLKECVDTNEINNYGIYFKEVKNNKTKLLKPPTCN